MINSNRPLLECLFEFPNLRFLSIDIKHMETVYLIGESIKDCPDLKHLHLTRFYPSFIENQYGVIVVRPTTRSPTITHLDISIAPF
jgi:hypothetical protein